MRPTLLTVGVIGVVSTACGSAGANTGCVAIRDSAGIEIVESTPPPRDAAPSWTIDTIPLFDIGADPGDPNQEFDAPSNPVRLADGRIAVADPGSQEIRFFDSAGVWLGNVGRKGQGPGEFTSLAELHLGPGDSLYAYERGTGFVHVLDAEGRYARRTRLQFPGEGRFAIFSGVFADGRWLVDGSKHVFPTAPGVFRGTATLYEYSAEGAPLDSIASIPSGEAYGEPFGRAGFRFLLTPFRRASVTVVQGPRVFFGVTERVDLRVYQSGTGVERIIRIQLPEQPLTRELIEQAVARQVAGWTRTPVVEREEYRRKILGASHPAQVPAISALVIAASGDLWFREYVVDPDGPVRYVVADSTGRFKAFALGPARFTPSWIGADRVIGLWRDPDDVVHVRGYRLRTQPN